MEALDRFRGPLDRFRGPLDRFRGPLDLEDIRRRLGLLSFPGIGVLLPGLFITHRQFTLGSG